MFFEKTAFVFYFFAIIQISNDYTYLFALEIHITLNNFSFHNILFDHGNYLFKGILIKI